MIVKEYYETTQEGVKLYKTYSDSNCYIQKAGTSEIYREAIDVEDSSFEYIELDEKFETETPNGD